MLCLPFFGLLLVFIFRLWGKESVIDVFETHELYTNRDKKRGVGVETIDEAIFMNVNDALLLSDVGTRKRLILNIIKSNPEEYIATLRTALNNDDIETSHYASSAIAHMQSKLLLEVQDYVQKYDRLQAVDDFLKNFAQILDSYVNSGLVDRKGVLVYSARYKEILVSLVDKEIAEVEHFVELIKIELNEKNYKSSFEYVKTFLDRYSDTEEPYICMLKVCVESKNAEILKEAIDYVKNSKVSLSTSGLTYLRYWNNHMV